jgi:hypothetical protein
MLEGTQIYKSKLKIRLRTIQIILIEEILSIVHPLMIEILGSLKIKSMRASKDLQSLKWLP